MGVRRQEAFGQRAAAEERGARAGEPGLGTAVALTGFLAATKIAETATGVVLSAAGVLRRAKTPPEHAAAPGGE
ncbi:hypothetical protein [Amycolatopsis kentuckyensis]|uniref:hypothetical protein n=1 Tax=Amycolatopsis kentuckyensis TaxID=218823 RepID=UPI000A3B21D0|nr:hypothetical protein [Amycolatopsis kentuckyensis]